ncbi:murein L,D-transpeptidase [Mucilaginibacter sp. ZT4R22]|uniref:Murein L,D-transpeptidase n=1 Tax=Mucilaginibacter pankratovii TaxID=2772110 RepID=A0ABR7WP92_9SPHI|nr:L,D-transpeptidase family protein [Mucilaginibacter pankratovii]MBD1364153.1 murein L,D-transpeptidase [Mucilaginibacter pankratovii]
MPKLFFVLLISFLSITKPSGLPDSKRASDARATLWPKLQRELSDGGFDSNYRIYLRIFKQTDQFEVWVKKGAKYALFKRYDICYYSGGLGTKTKQGDGKSPEGFYNITAKQLNPGSNYHLAINIGYPNQLEQQKGYTGSAIMIHGHCASIGCYAMTDARIEEIYTLVYKALAAGQQKINLDIFPFQMDKGHMELFASSPYLPFWKTMKPGFDLFEKNRVPSVARVVRKEYSFGK